MPPRRMRRSFAPSSSSRLASTRAIRRLPSRCLLASISDPNGQADIWRVGDNELIKGRLESDTRKLPVSFYAPPSDNGQPPDRFKGDGVFSTLGKAGGAMDQAVAMTVRVAVMDRARTVVVADALLPAR